MLLQGFRPDYVLKGNLSDQIRLVSDAVPPPLARALAESVLRVLLRLRARKSKLGCSPLLRVPFVCWAGHVLTRISQSSHSDQVAIR